MKGLKPLRILFTASLVLSLGLFLFPGCLLAEDGVGISVSPLTFELTADPGDLQVNKLRVYNPTTSTVSIGMEVEDFTVSGEGGEVVIEPADTETYSLARWVVVEPQEFTLTPGEHRWVDFYMQVPENAEPGGHYGSILAHITGVVGEGMTGLATAQRVGTLLLLSVSGPVAEKLVVEEFSVPSFSEYGPIAFNIRLKNTGTVHMRPRGFVTITDWRGKKVTDLEFSQLNVIPGATRKLGASWDKKIIIGRFNATLVGSFGKANVPIEPVVVSFWVFPWKIGSAIFIAFLLLVFFFVKTRKRWLLALKILFKGER